MYLNVLGWLGVHSAKYTKAAGDVKGRGMNGRSRGGGVIDARDHQQRSLVSPGSGRRDDAGGMRRWRRAHETGGTKRDFLTRRCRFAKRGAIGATHRHLGTSYTVQGNGVSVDSGGARGLGARVRRWKRVRPW